MTDLQHERVLIRRGTRSGLPIIVAVHSTKFGPAAGGCRMTTYASWRDGLEDALRLSEAMTLKCAIVGLPNGGAKSVIPLPPGTVLDEAARREVMLDLGDAIELLGGDYRAGEDVGTTPEDMVIAHERTEWAYCLPESAGGIGDTSESTAVGVLHAIRAVSAQLFDTSDIAEKTFTIVGLGHVGGLLARLLTDAGATLQVADIDESKRALADELGARWIDLETAYVQPTDFLVPAALGGVLTEELVSQLKCRAIVGPANNQLAEESVAKLLDKEGILLAPDFVVNGGGVLFAALVEMQGVSKADAMERVASVGTNLTAILTLATERGITPHEAAVEHALARLAAPAA